MSILALDIGGTFVKYARFNAQGAIMGNSGRMPLNEHAPAGMLLDALIHLLQENPADVIGVCIPGPFDYDRGICLMQHKFAGIYGVSLQERFRAVLPDTPIFFLHDAGAFLLGEMADGNAEKCENSAAITLGTGLGFVAAHQGKLCLNEKKTPQRPLWNQPFRSGIAEDYVSRRGIRARYREGGGDEADVREIAARADAGEERARHVLRETGDMVAELLEMRMEMGFDRAVIGGQIAHAFAHLFPRDQSAYPVMIVPAAHISDGALRGIAWYAKETGILK